MSSPFASPQQWLWELAHSDAETSINNRIMWTKTDNTLAMQAHDLIVHQQAECEELRKQLEAERKRNTQLDSEIEARKAELSDAWRYHTEAEKRLAELRDNTLDIERVEQSIDKVEFALECLDNAGNMDSCVIISLMREALRLMHWFSQHNDNSKIPF